MEMNEKQRQPHYIRQVSGELSSMEIVVAREFAFLR